MARPDFGCEDYGGHPGSWNILTLVCDHRQKTSQNQAHVRLQQSEAQILTLQVHGQVVMVAETPTPLQ